VKEGCNIVYEEVQSLDMGTVSNVL